MTTPDSELRKYLQILSVGAPIWDRVPENQAYPYVHIQDINISDATTADQNLWEVDLLLDVVTGFDGKQGGRKQADTISMALLSAFLDYRQIDLGTFLIITSELTGTNYIDEALPPNYLVRKLIRLRLVVEQT